MIVWEYAAKQTGWSEWPIDDGMRLDSMHPVKYPRPELVHAHRHTASTQSAA